MSEPVQTDQTEQERAKEIGDDLVAEILVIGHNRDAYFARIDSLTPFEIDAYMKALDRAMGPERTEAFNEEHPGVVLTPSNQARWEQLVKESASASSEAQKAPTWH